VSHLTLTDWVVALTGVPQEKVTVIPHGVPALTFVPPPSPPSPFRLLTFGFFRPDKGIEQVLGAIESLRPSGHAIELVIAGSSQPQFPEQVAYQARIHELVSHMGLDHSVSIVSRFLTRREQVELIRSSHMGVFAYQEPNHSWSGALSLTLAAGRPVVCTPFEGARAAEEELEGIYVASGFTADEIAGRLEEAISAASQNPEVSAAAHARSGKLAWPLVGRSYTELLTAASLS
jgi:glycosyltransferase involved in cell wall biosynthesis